MDISLQAERLAPPKYRSRPGHDLRKHGSPQASTGEKSGAFFAAIVTNSFAPSFSSLLFLFAQALNFSFEAEAQSASKEINEQTQRECKSRNPGCREKLSDQ